MLGGVSAQTTQDTLYAALRNIHEPLWLRRSPAGWSVAASSDGQAFAPRCDPAELGGFSRGPGSAAVGSGFCDAHDVRYPYMTGAMARGIASVELVTAAAEAGLLGVFGAAGLRLGVVQQAIRALRQRLGERAFAVNMIFSPQETGQEARLCELLLHEEVRRVAASAYVALTPQLVRYRFHGTRVLPDGRLVTPNRLLAKVSRQELAAKFLAPPPEALLREVVQAGYLSERQAKLASTLPLAEDVTVEADSGGHTDRRPAINALPEIIALRDRLAREHGYATRPRVGAAGGIATPWSVAGAFALGANYVVAGSINQSCVEAGTSPEAKALLCGAAITDCAMAPAADMFEMGAKVQVLKRGSMFAQRASKLDQLYRSCESLDDIPADERGRLEQRVFAQSLDQVWRQTAAYFATVDPRQLERAEESPKHKMALVFRWYLGQSSTWAQRGDAERKGDYQIWCGPSMGAFNSWVAGSPLAAPENRRVVDVAHSLLYGAALATRLHQLRQQGADFTDQLEIRPLPRKMLARLLEHDARPAVRYAS
jgi:trans-AT polyketide synthase/acyltransferase/oxidoreductase domain-containing protein